MKEDKIKLLLGNTAFWNGGAGLIVPPHVAKLLKSMGYTKGYTANRNVEPQLSKSNKLTKKIEQIAKSS